MYSDIDAHIRRWPSRVMLVSLSLGILVLVILGNFALHRMRQRAAALEAPATPALATPSLPEDTVLPFPTAVGVTVEDGSTTDNPGAEPPASTPLPPIRRNLARTTILLLGSDVRPQDDGPWQTDTIILLTLDPDTGQAGVLSIPRDLWVPIPDHLNGRINTACYLGDVDAYPGGGPALAMETVRQNLGVAIQHYVRVDFQGLVTLVDLIGGIDVNVERTIDDPNYPFLGPDGEEVYGRLTIEAGPQHFDGDMALKYARTRYNGGDIDRTRRQQQILRAILQRVADLKLLPELLDNAPEIYATLQASVQTDMSLDVIAKLATQALQVEGANLRFRVIDDTCVRPWTTPDGGQVLLPLWDKIRPLRDDVFGVSLPTEAP
ncbi:MAG TPA: LCP family protein [Anaerolineae bacterium]|nr:LCP family protein [Anaerolineae bacterium]HQH37309.1 LCP family protein [Anaerolineae bacterium]